MNNVKFKGGHMGYCHTTALENLVQPTRANLAPCEHNMDSEILNIKLKRIVQLDKRSRQEE